MSGPILVGDFTKQCLGNYPEGKFPEKKSGERWRFISAKNMLNQVIFTYGNVADINQEKYKTSFFHKADSKFASVVNKMTRVLKNAELDKTEAELQTEVKQLNFLKTKVIEERTNWKGYYCAFCKFFFGGALKKAVKGFEAAADEKIAIANERLDIIHKNQENLQKKHDMSECKNGMGEAALKLKDIRGNIKEFENKRDHLKQQREDIQKKMDAHKENLNAAKAKGVGPLGMFDYQETPNDKLFFKQLEADDKELQDQLGKVYGQLSDLRAQEQAELKDYEEFKEELQRLQDS